MGNVIYRIHDRYLNDIKLFSFEPVDSMTRYCCDCKRELGESHDWLDKPFYDKYKFLCKECNIKRLKMVKKRKSKSIKSKQEEK